ncbi:hypothetical protein [Sulfitobacter guttiformis]|uniref:Uncharacterized protein n=1 Tax=Sulfitobacter guttiformis TaxID=74349 RepID=A0A420DRZ1_9RHOB|nr:hypothetical protein [Sulfitobacter guttiformis]KIN74326.1 Acyl-CoA dehydrogenase [Sulfitobacter guttiformis KCTC 32187]RKE96923.1 hypothetical protein C8N30_1504 [Sulfitobacter guttiformis]
MKTFAQNLMKLAPEWVSMPPELIETFDWLEDNAELTVHRTGEPQDYALSLYSDGYKFHPAISYFGFCGTILTYTGHWKTPDPAIDARIFEIGETAADGGRLAIWLDENGKQQFVHIGHDTLGVITDDPQVLLQFLAMGYPEPGYLQDPRRTPLADFLSIPRVNSVEDLPEDERPVFPIAFQEFLKDHFDLAIPNTAHDLGIENFSKYEDPDTSDPFALWIASVTPAATEADLAYELELMRTVESLDIKDTDSTETVMDKIGSLFKSKGAEQ